MNNVRIMQYGLEWPLCKTGSYLTPCGGREKTRSFLQRKGLCKCMHEMGFKLAAKWRIDTLRFYCAK